MRKSNHVLNHSFKKIAITTLLSLISTSVVLQVQANEVTKPSAEPVMQSQLSVTASVDINSANAEELADALNGVGLERAKAIIAWREKNGQFKHIDDLLKVRGIGKKILAANAGKISL